MNFHIVLQTAAIKPWEEVTMMAAAPKRPTMTRRMKSMQHFFQSSFYFSEHCLCENENLC